MGVKRNTTAARDWMNMDVAEVAVKQKTIQSG